VIYTTPSIGPGLRERLDELGELRAALGSQAGGSSRWMGSLRRSLRASSIESSTSIEGYSLEPDEALALVNGDLNTDSGDENRMAVACYARAMDHVGALAGDPAFRWLDRVVLDLHFDACYFQPDKEPGRWRQGPIGVTASDGSLEFRGPDPEAVPGLMAEVVEWLQEGDLDAPVVVRAAMAHLHVTSVHPFRDGNGRISRIVQSPVLARDGGVSPELASIEEYLGDHTPAYYAALRGVQAGGYNPGRDATGWVDFCVEAHIIQAERRLEQIEEAASRWGHLEELVEAREWPDRIVIALEQSLIGGTDRARYGNEAEVSQATASGDFRRLLDAGLVKQVGKGRSTRYRASEQLRTELPDD
jgi:Fic family protein